MKTDILMDVWNGCCLKKPFFIAGPCVIESKSMTCEIAEELKSVFSRLGMPFIFKASYDKANRTSIKSFRGHGIDRGLQILRYIKKEFDIPVIIDVHCAHDVKKVAAVADIIQIPAFLCRQTDLIISAAKTGKIVNVKKGQFLSPYDMKNVIEKIKSVRNNKIILTERGTSFGYNNLVVDMRSIVIMKKFGFPVVFDATHSVQIPGGLGNATGGQSEFIIPLARAAFAAGADGLFMEVHPDPDRALSDGKNSVKLSHLQDSLKKICSCY